MSSRAELTFPMIFREIQRCAYCINITDKKYNYNDPELKAKVDYNPMDDIAFIWVKYKDKEVVHKLPNNAFRFSLDNFAEFIIMPLLTELQDSFNMYDDCGQII